MIAERDKLVKKLTHGVERASAIALQVNPHNDLVTDLDHSLQRKQLNAMLKEIEQFKADLAMVPTKNSSRATTILAISNSLFKARDLVEKWQQNLQMITQEP